MDLFKKDQLLVNTKGDKSLPPLTFFRILDISYGTQGWSYKFAELVEAKWKIRWGKLNHMDSMEAFGFREPTKAELILFGNSEVTKIPMWKPPKKKRNALGRKERVY